MRFDDDRALASIGRDILADLCIGAEKHAVPNLAVVSLGESLLKVLTNALFVVADDIVRVLEQPQRAG